MSLTLRVVSSSNNPKPAQLEHKTAEAYEARWLTVLKKAIKKFLKNIHLKNF